MNFILCKSYFKKAVKRKEQCIGIGFINLSVIKLLEENKNLNLNDLGLGKDLLDMTLKRMIHRSSSKCITYAV